MAESHYPECDLFDPICTGNSGGHIPRWMVGHACVACKKPCICHRLRAAEARVADAIRDRILDYAATLDGKATRSVALTCASLATTAGLR